jgi:hypothetical protein
MFFTQANLGTTQESESSIWGTEPARVSNPWNSAPAEVWASNTDNSEPPGPTAVRSVSSHNISDADTSLPICKFYVSGWCSAGEGCRFSHHNGPLDAYSDYWTCGICSENVVTSGRKFGLLDNCEDVFCLECLREWRNQKEKQDRANLRRCPLCRVESFVVIPSSSFLVGEEKRLEKDKYCKYLSSIPCKNYDRGNGSCQFGSSCLYKHGGELSSSSFVVIKGADGKKTKKSAQLCDFLR